MARQNISIGALKNISSYEDGGDEGVIEVDGAATDSILVATSVGGIGRFILSTIASAGGAKKTEPYIVLTASADLTNERVITMGDGLAQADSGPGNALTLRINISGLTGESAIAATDVIAFWDITATSHRKITFAELETALTFGDVTGPGSSTNNAIVRFDGTTGKTLQDSLVTISDLGEVHIIKGSAGAYTAGTSADDLVIESNINAGISIGVPDISTSFLAFGGPTDASGALISWAHSALLMTIGTHIAGGILSIRSANDVEAVRIAASGNVSIGIAIGDGTLHVHTASAGTITASTAGDDFVIENSVNGGMTILVPDLNLSTVYFGTPSDATGAFLQWDFTNGDFYLWNSKSAGTIIFGANNAQGMQLDGTGKLVMSATTTTRASINFPHGTAPTTPVNGDVWTTTAGLFARINGATVGPYT